jgi:GGDEF domain-containing protein
LGEAYASLRVWSEVRPNYVKIDRHFVQAAAVEPSVRRMLEMIVSLSYDVGSVTIAEGVETETQWQLMYQLGFDCVQGFLFASPAPQLLHALPEPRQKALLNKAATENRWFAATRKVASLAMPIPPATPATDNEAIYRRFLDQPSLSAIPVVDAGEKPIGLIGRQRFLEDFCRPYRPELSGRKSCCSYVSESRVISADATIHDLTRYFQTLELTELGCPFLIVDGDGRYLGIGDGQALLRTLVQVHLEAARYANPLTGLPGSVPINERIAQYLARQIPFVVSYVDISHFKAYNDVYGFVQGDEMIRLVAELLKRNTNHPDDFVGHIGGDDFIVVWGDPEWEERVAALFASFTSALPQFYRAEDWERGGISAEDRQGNQAFHPVSALTVGALRVLPGLYDSYRNVASAASEAKKMAKKASQQYAAQGIVPANAFFVERRSPRKPALPEDGQSPFWGAAGQP